MHKLEVRVAKTGMTVRARKNYRSASSIRGAEVRP